MGAAEELGPPSDYRLGFILKGQAKDIFWGTFVALAIYTVGFGILYGLGEIEITAVHFSAYDFLLSWILMLLVALAEEIAFRGFVLGHLLTAGVQSFCGIVSFVCIVFPDAYF